MIYQLMKTTPYLSGQVRIDLACDRVSGDSTLLLDSVSVVPLSDRIWYSPEENQINNRHTDNVVALYKATQGSFYKCLGDLSLETKYPNYTSGIVDTVDHTYQMGLKRIQRARYGKELSFLLPMWIDSVEDVKNLEFFVHVDSTRNKDGEFTEITSRKFEMSDRLRKYLTDYFDGVGDDLMYIGIRDNISYITGLEVSTGTFLTKDVSRIIPNLLERERPLIETDNIVARQFSDSKMVARQLVNFNLVFSMNDLFEATIEREMHWTQLNVWCEAKLKSGSAYKPIPIKDIYSNYTDIHSYKISNDPMVSGSFVVSYEDEGGTKTFNVLDYLQDYNSIDLMHTNKILQPNFHWAFRDNQRYTWNLYNGFSPLVEDGGTVHRVSGRFFGSPDMMSSTYSAEANNIQWIRVNDGTKYYVPGSIASHFMRPQSSTRFTGNKYGIAWAYGIKYNVGTTLKDGVSKVIGSDHVTIKSDDMYANFCVVEGDQFENLSKDKVYCAVYRKKNPDGTFSDVLSMIYVIEQGTTLSGYSHIDSMTFQGIRNILNPRIDCASSGEYSDVFGNTLYGTDDSAEDGELHSLFVCIDESRDPTEPMEDTEETQKCRMLIELFLKVLNTIEYPNVVRFSKSVGFYPAPAPSIEHLVDSNVSVSAIMNVEYASEIKYSKIDDNFISYLYRYDGNILPQFIDPEIEVKKTDPEDGSRWTLADYGAYNLTWRKKLFLEMSDAEIDCMNYIDKQKIYVPDYPSLKYYYEVGEPVKLKEPNVPEGYLGEICWFQSNKMYYADTDFSIVKKNTTSDKMTEESIEEMFLEYVLESGIFAHLKTDAEEQDLREMVMGALWPRYTYDCDWEYHSLDDVEHYDFKVNFHLI